MNKLRGILLIGLIVFSLMLIACSSEEADDVESKGNGDIDYPIKPIKILVGYAPGGGTDMGARVVAEKLGKVLSDDSQVSVVVENKPGGGGVVAMTEVLNTDDVYTIGFTPAGTINLQPHYGHTTYEYDQSEPISHIAATSFVLAVKADSKWDDFDSFLDDVKQNPGEYSYGHPGVGTPGELSFLALEEEVGIEIKGIPFEGNAPARTALLANDVDIVSISEDEVMPHVESGELKVLLNLSRKDIEGYPDIEKAVDKGFDMDFVVSWLFYGPENMDSDIITKLDNAIKETIEDDEVIESLERLGFPIQYLNAEETKKLLEEQYKKHEELVKLSEQ